MEQGDFWLGGREIVATLWDAHAWLWHGYEVTICRGEYPVSSTHISAVGSGESSYGGRMYFALLPRGYPRGLLLPSQQGAASKGDNDKLRGG